MTTTEPLSTTGPLPPRPRRRGPTARVLLVAGVVLGILLLARGALFLVDLALSSTTTQHESYPAAGSVELVADGEVTVRAGDGESVEVDRISRGGLSHPTYRAETSGDTLDVAHDCSPAWSWATPRCEGSLDVTLPADTRLVVRTSNGDVVATGVAGDVDLETSNGDVEATRVGGRLTATSSNGDVTVRDVGGDAEVRTSNGSLDVADVGGAVAAESSNGRVEVSGAAGDVDARSSNGDVTVRGDGDPVALTIDTSHGEQVVEGPTDPGATRTVEVRSSNGDVQYLAP